MIANAPFLDDGTPMPTRYWLVDPTLREVVSTLESTGGVRLAESSVPSERIAEAHARYADERDALIPADHTGPRPSGGVGGTRQGVKCLHAHLAWWLDRGRRPGRGVDGPPDRAPSRLTGDRAAGARSMGWRPARDASWLLDGKRRHTRVDLRNAAGWEMHITGAR